MEQQWNERDSLTLIESMINKAKNNFNETGTLYLVWGIVVFICSLFQFIAVHFYHYQQAYYIWCLSWAVLIYQVIFLRNKKKRIKVRTYTDDILKYIWTCFVFCLLVLMFILQYQRAYVTINPAILVLYSIPTFLSGAVLKFKPLTIGGISCWLFAIGSVFAAMDYQVLFLCGAVLTAWIIPGIILRKRFLATATKDSVHSERN
ncbi:MAG: hypothetical protein JWQ27_1368 [Ferruginibacter sp.]|nr:hypothetical protein [Ferruginibacter sp.]